MVNFFRNQRNPKPDSPKATSEPPQKNGGDAILPNYAKGVMPCKIVFLSGPYKGKALNLGNGIVESSQDQQQNRRNQEGFSLRVGSNFVNVSTRGFNLSLEFYDPQNDISEWVENCMTLQEIDPDTGNTPTILYSEGSMQGIAPLTCRGIKASKQHPFPGGKGFHYAKVDISLDLLGGKQSEHRFAKPLMETELTRWAATKTKAEKERQAVVEAATAVLAKCLTPQENQQLQDLLKSNKAGNAGAVSRLSPSALVQAATAGLIPKETLTQLGGKLDDAISFQIASKTSGAGRNVPRLAAAIQTGKTGGLPADLAQQVEQLQGDYNSIKKAIAEQDLGPQSQALNRPTTAGTLIKIAGCGMSMRQSGAVSIAKDQQPPPEWDAFFNQKLGAKSSDPVARDQYVLEEANKALSDTSLTDQQIADRFGLATPEQATKLRKGRPYKNKEDFILRVDAQGVTGRSKWSSFIDSLVQAAPANPATPPSQ